MTSVKEVRRSLSLVTKKRSIYGGRSTTEISPAKKRPVDEPGQKVREWFKNARLCTFWIG